MSPKKHRKVSPKIWLIFAAGIILFISGILILQFGGHRNHLKGGLLTLTGFIVGGAYALGILQSLKATRSSDLNDVSKKDTSSLQE